MDVIKWSKFKKTSHKFPSKTFLDADAEQNNVMFAAKQILHMIIFVGNKIYFLRLKN
jgi:hypothetical protein